jgi:hypothetical protein
MYVTRSNAFIINDDLVYLSPVEFEDLSLINAALAIDDRLGAPIGEPPGDRIRCAGKTLSSIV